MKWVTYCIQKKMLETQGRWWKVWMQTCIDENTITYLSKSPNKIAYFGTFF